MELDVTNTTYTDMRTKVDDYSVNKMVIDEAGVNAETYWENQNWPQYLGYYKTIPELKKAIDALACWTAGKGYIANRRTTNQLKLFTGWGEDSFDSIMQNMIIVKKINGDAYAEIIKEEKTNMIINLKPLNPYNIRTVVNQKGRIIRYEEYDPSKKKVKRTFKPEQIFHIVNDRVANEIHGTSVIEACKWVIDARNEAMADWRRLLHRSTIRVVYVDMEDTTTLATLKGQYAEAVKYGEVMLVPGKRGEVEVVDYPTVPSQPFMDTIRYYENFFYQAVGVPKIILGGAAEYTEASSKVGYLTFEQVYMAEQRLLEQDIFQQLYLTVKFDRPTSLKDEMQGSEEANTGQVGFQPKETNMGGLNRE